MSYCIILTLTSNFDEAKKIAEILVKEKLAACVNIIKNVTSFYEWKNEICQDSEYLLLIKTRKELFEKVKTCVLENHSYELPALLMLPVEAGLFEYLSWIDKNTAQGQ